MNVIIKDLQCHPHVRKIPSDLVLGCAAIEILDSPHCTQPALTTQDLCPTHTLFNQMHNASKFTKRNTHTRILPHWQMHVMIMEIWDLIQHIKTPAASFEPARTVNILKRREGKHSVNWCGCVCVCVCAHLCVSLCVANGQRKETQTENNQSRRPGMISAMDREGSGDRRG